MAKAKSSTPRAWLRRQFSDSDEAVYQTIRDYTREELADLAQAYIMDGSTAALRVVVCAVLEREEQGAPRPRKRKPPDEPLASCLAQSCDKLVSYSHMLGYRTAAVHTESAAVLLREAAKEWVAMNPEQYKPKEPRMKGRRARLRRAKIIDMCDRLRAKGGA